MIPKSTPPGTIVFHEAYGLGKFVRFRIPDPDSAIVQFEDETHIIHRRHLTEIEEK